MTNNRRARGDGSIQRSESGSGWVALYELPRGLDGRRRRKKRRAKTRAEAVRLLRKMQEEYGAGGRLADRQRLLATTMNDYLALRHVDDMQKSSLDREIRFCNLICEYFGRTKVADLTVEDCDRFLLAVSQGLPKDGEPTRPLVGRDHVRRLRSTLRRALLNDMRLGLVAMNVAELSELPPDIGSYEDRRALSLSELDRLLDACDGATQLLVDLIGRHGLRPAEARAVTWANVNEDLATLRVTGQIDSTNCLAPPKTARAVRSIRLHASTVTRLTSWRDQQRRQQGDAGPAWQDLDLVVTTGVGTPVDRNNFNRSIRLACRAAGIEPSVRPYELRHTAITHQCQRGLHAWQVADWAGTSEKMIYLHYRHLLDELIDVAPLDF